MSIANVHSRYTAGVLEFYDPTTGTVVFKIDGAGLAVTVPTGVEFVSGDTAQALVNLDLGSSGTAGSLDIFPTTASKGKLAITAADSSGNTTTSIVNASQAAARTYTIPDAGASASFVMTEGSQTVNGTKTIGTLVTTNLDAGASGTAGSVDIFPGTGSKGKIAITAADSAGDTTTAIVNASQAGARTYTIPDAGASASFVMTAGAQTLTGNTTLGSGADLIFSGTTGQSEITFTDNLADALSIKITGGADFITFDSTNSDEKLAILSAVTQKLGFWNVTPVVQPASANQAALSLDVDVTGGDTVDKAAVDANFSALQTLVNQLRTDLVNLGLIKGAA